MQPSSTTKHLWTQAALAGIFALAPSIFVGACFDDQPGLGDTDDECADAACGESAGDGDGDEAVCGDGQIDLGEECDMGLLNGTNVPCTIVCTLAICGDGMVNQGLEQCDDGNDVDDDDCANDCTLPSCGDGEVQPGEECDHGTDNGDHAECHENCRWDVCGDGLVGPEEACDEGPLNGTSESCSETCTSEEPPPIEGCGNGELDPGELCDDGNDIDGDACANDCTPVDGCAEGANIMGQAPSGGMSVCMDPDHDTCEEDFISLCAPGWSLCTPLQHSIRHGEWDLDLPGQQALGAIRCRASGGAGHFTVFTVGTDTPDNCQFGSSRPECPSNFGCTETQDAALCCAPTHTCGNGVVDSPEEECDDGNADDEDECLTDCRTRLSQGTYCG